MRSKTFVAVLAGSVLVAGTWAWAQQNQPAQPGGTGQPGPQGGPGGMMMGGQGQQGGMMGGMGMAPGMMGRPGGMGPGMMMGQHGGSRFERPLITEILSAADQLNLSADQAQRLRGLRTDFEKEAIRRGADIQVAEVDLRELLVAEAPDLARAEAQVKKVAALQGELRFARIKTLAEGRAVLSKDQWQKFEALAPQPGPMGPGRGRGPRQRGGMGQPGPGMGPGGMMMGGMGMGSGMMGGMGQQGMSGMMGQGMMGGQQAAAGANAAARTDATGPVTVVATLLPSRGDRILFEVKLDTHSVELDTYGFDTAVSLRNDRGESAPPVVESPTGSGHHRAITLAFPGGLAGGGAKRLELIVRDLGGVKERVLRWDAPFAGN